MKSLKSNQKGFTLIEMLVAISIFAIGLLSIASMQITALQVNSRSSTLTSVTGVAEGILEEILSWNTDNPVFQVNSGPTTWDFQPETAGAQTTVDIDGAGTYQATYSIVANSPVNNVSRVTVTVTGPRNLTLIGYKRYVN